MTSSGMPMEPNIRTAPRPGRRIAGPRSLAGRSLQVLRPIIEIRSGRGQGKGVHVETYAQFSTRCPLRRWSWWPVAALVGGLFGRSALVAQDQVADQYKVFTAALERRRGKLRRRGRSPTAWSTAPSAACCRRWTRIRASWIPAATRRCASGRKAAITASASPSRWSTATSPSFNVFEGSPAYQRGLRRGDVIAKIEGEDTKGWTTEQAVRRLRGPKGTPSTSRCAAPATTS